MKDFITGYFFMIVLGAIIMVGLTWFINRRDHKKYILEEIKLWLGVYTIISIAWTFLVFSLIFLQSQSSLG